MDGALCVCLRTAVFFFLILTLAFRSIVCRARAFCVWGLTDALTSHRHLCLQLPQPPLLQPSLCFDPKCGSFFTFLSFSVAPRGGVEVTVTYMIPTLSELTLALLFWLIASPRCYPNAAIAKKKKDVQAKQNLTAADLGHEGERFNVSPPQSLIPPVGDLHGVLEGITRLLMTFYSPTSFYSPAWMRQSTGGGEHAGLECLAILPPPLLISFSPQWKSHSAL